MVNELNQYTKETCKICGRTFLGEDARLQAEKCNDAHELIVISVWDFELPGVINYFSSGNREFLPKSFLKKLRNLRGRALKVK